MSHALINALGRNFLLRFDEDVNASFKRLVRRAWAGAATPDASVRIDGEVLIAPGSSRPGPVLSDLSAIVTRRAIESNRGELWMAHAGGVANDAGSVCMLVGPSGAGKTTATRRLSQHFSYVSDETVAVTRDGGVLPYRKPLSLVTAGEPWKRQLAPGELGLGELPSAALRLRIVVVLDRRNDAPIEPQSVPLRTLDALEAVCEQSSALTSMPTPLTTVADHLRLAPAFRVTYRDDADLVPTIRTLLESADSALPERITSEPRTLVPSKPTQPHVFRTSAFVDAVADETDLMMLRRASNGEGLLNRVRGLGPVLWRACRAGASLDALTAAALNALGAPPSGETAEELTRAALNDLCNAGLIDRPVARD